MYTIYPGGREAGATVASPKAAMSVLKCGSPVRNDAVTCGGSTIRGDQGHVDDINRSNEDSARSNDGSNRSNDGSNRSK